MKESVTQAGHMVALTRASSHILAEAAVSEYTEGVECYKRICELDSRFDSDSSDILSSFAKLLSRIASKDRLTFFYTGSEDRQYAESAVSLFPSVPYERTESKISPLPKKNEGIAVPAQITYSAMVGNALDYTDFLSGYFTSVRTILSYGFLWNEIRVMGGAYGTGFLQRASGITGFYSFRDPDSARSLGKYRESSAFLRNLADSGADLTEFIIGALGDSDPLLKPKLISSLAVTYHLSGTTYEDRAKRRRQILTTSKDDLYAVADILDKIIDSGCACVVGPTSKLETCGLDDIIEIS